MIIIFFKAKINIHALPSKSKIEKYSYLPRINLCELVNEAKQRLSMQREPFYYILC